MDGVELLALSGGMSIAIVALIGFGLNYTSWGIKLESVLLCVANFVYITSAIALARRTVLLKRIDLTTEVTLKLPVWKGGAIDKSFSIALVVLILGTLGALGYFIAHRSNETFSEFYVLGNGGHAQDYPSAFILENGQVTYVRYGAGAYQANNGWGEVTLGIVNHEKQETTYLVKITVDGRPVAVNYNGAIIDELEPVKLQPGEKWEGVVGFAPQHLGDNQQVEFVLSKGDIPAPDDSLQFWVNVDETFSEFYVLGIEGQAQDYPSVFVMENGQVTYVKYATGAYQAANGWGEVTLGIVNHEKQEMTYLVKITVDERYVTIKDENAIVNELGLIRLQPGEKWERKAGFAPQYLGDNQQVEFQLFKFQQFTGEYTTPDDYLQLWVNVRESQ